MRSGGKRLSAFQRYQRASSVRRNRRLAVRLWYSARSVLSRRCTTPAISFCTWVTVNAGVHFFPPPCLLRQEPRRAQGRGLVVVPPPPGADLIVPQARLPLGPLQALLHPVLGLEHPGVFPQRRRQAGVAQKVVVLPRP